VIDNHWSDTTVFLICLLAVASILCIFDVTGISCGPCGMNDEGGMCLFVWPEMSTCYSKLFSITYAGG